MPDRGLPRPVTSSKPAPALHPVGQRPLAGPDVMSPSVPGGNAYTARCAAAPVSAPEPAAARNWSASASSADQAGAPRLVPPTWNQPA